jgi:RecJ-like exonuclease
MAPEEVQAVNTTYPVRLREWVRHSEATRVCPVCQGHGWVSEPIRVLYHGKMRNEAAVTIDCYFCGGTGRVAREGNDN